VDTLYWFWPERAGLATLIDDQQVWVGYRDAAAATGLALDVITVDDVVLAAGPGGNARAYVRGEPVDPDRAVFHTKLYTWPMFQPDVWRCLSTFEALRAAGYCTLVRGELNLLTNDKLCTLLHLRDADGGWLPTVRVPTRDFAGLAVRLADAGVDYPVVVKPASWGAGMGVVRAGDEHELVMALRLASAAELTMVVQPYLSAAGEITDTRVFCVDREPVRALRRTAAGTVANVTGGGRAQLVDVPDELRERARAVAKRLDPPWLGVDFLSTGAGYALSEVEVDACVSAQSLALPGMADVLAARFRAYRSDFDRWRDR
jgi:hypothetical protein